MVFKRRIRDILESHKSMTNSTIHRKLFNETLSKEELDYEFMIWAEELIVVPIDNALRLIPPNYDSPAYKDVESYRQEIEKLKMLFLNDNINYDALKSIDEKAGLLCKNVSDLHEENIWGDVFIKSLYSKIK